MDLGCLALLLKSHVSGELSCLLEASKDITDLEILYARLSIIALGHSMKEPGGVLRERMQDVFDDIDERIKFPVLHERIPGAPQAIQAFMAVFIGVFLVLYTLWLYYFFLTGDTEAQEEEACRRMYGTVAG
ncbi:hypothetical protein DL96DRAFT_1712523 [Flagelloscypha sp. PMI_526]|nr:hypothetical protein DL96DRAFT_1712523 [Flagelloscypha sp. PMI_526]